MAKKWFPKGRNPMTGDNTRIEVKSHGVEFRNIGDVECMINEFWTLKPNGEPKYFGWDSLEMVLEGEFRFKFKEGVQGVKRVEVAEMIVYDFDYDCI